MLMAQAGQHQVPILLSPLPAPPCRELTHCFVLPAETTVAMRILFEASSNTRRDSRMAWYNEATSAWVFENSIAVQPDIVSGVPTLRIRALRLYKHVAVFERFQTLGDAAFRTPFLEETTQFHRVLNTLTLRQVLVCPGPGGSAL
eukprot:272772-Rhodomonas_salina.2